MHKKLDTKIESLAIFSGKPAFTKMLHIGQPNIGNHERLMNRINRILDKRWLTNAGEQVQELERRVSSMCGVKHCIAMCNGTVALEIVIRALELSGEVIVPSFTFIATAHALQWQQINPIFCDINPNTHNIDPSRIEALITPRTTGIVGVHLWGRPCDVDTLTKIAEKNNLKLLFDASHAFGCSHRGNMVGGFGHAEVFSFHATKLMNSFEGGAVVTNDDELAAKIRLMKNFGFAGYDNVIYIGTNGKMSEVSAAMGLTSLESFEEFIAVSRNNYECYQSCLKGIPGINIVPYDTRERCNYQYIVLEIDENITKISRDHLLKVLHAENVLARRYFYPGCHRMEPYRSYFPNAKLLLPITEWLAKRILQLPTGNSIGKQEINVIGEIIRLAIDRSSEIPRQLKTRSDD